MLFERKFRKSRVGYYVNCTSSFNLAELKISCSGNIHPLPGPHKRNVGAIISTKDSPERKVLSVFYANARSIVNKRHLLDLELAQTIHDIIVSTETHLDDSIDDLEIFPNCYTVFRRDRASQGG